MAAKAAAHGAPQKAFSRNASDENERWRWTEDVYQRKNDDKEKNNNYDWNRRELNFEINKGKIEKLGSNELRLHERLQQKLDELEFKTYKDNAQNKPNCCVDWVFSGDHDRMCEMAFGMNYREIDYSLKTDNTEAIKKTDAYKYHHPEGKKKPRQPEIYKWAMEVYKFACRKWGEENIIGIEVHLDETTPHAHVLMVPVAERKSRGRASTKYVRKDDPTVTIKKQEYEQLSKEEKQDYQPVSRKSKRQVSYSGVFGDNYEERKAYMKQFHTDFYEQVGRYFGLERGDDLDLLEPEERRKRRHMRKDQLHIVQEHERKNEEVARQNAELAQRQQELQDDIKEKEQRGQQLDKDNAGRQGKNDKLKEKEDKLNESIKSKADVLKGIEERIKSLPSEEELNRREVRDKELPTLEQLLERERKNGETPTLEEITEREERSKAVPALAAVVNQEKKFKTAKKQLTQLLKDVRTSLEEDGDYTSLGELNKIGLIADETKWFNAATLFLNNRNRKIIDDTERLKKEEEARRSQIILLTDQVRQLQTEQKTAKANARKLADSRRKMYAASVLPKVDGSLEIMIRNSAKGETCVTARLNGENLSEKIAADVLADYNDGVATKEQVAALYLTADILKAVKGQHEKDMAESAAQGRRSMYEGLILPNFEGDVNITVRKYKGKDAIIANVGGEAIGGYYLSDGQVKDLEDGVADKDQLGALLMSGNILKYVNDKKAKELDDVKKDLVTKKAELANIHVPTKTEIESAKKTIVNARMEEYEKLMLPKIRDKIETDIARTQGDAVNIYVWAKVGEEGKWHSQKLTDGQYQDFKDGVATKEQLAALLLSDDIINDATEQAHKRLMNFEEKPWETELAKRTVSLSGELGTTIKQTINDLDDMTRELHPNPTPERLGRINFMLSFLVESGQAKDRREAADRLCNIAIPLTNRCDGLWREHVVDIVKAVAEQGTQTDLQQGRNRGRGIN